MPRENAITVEGTVVEVLGERLFRAELVNGHRVIAHPTRQSRLWLDGVGVGVKLRLEMSPFDMSKGRIVGVPDAGSAVRGGQW